MSIYSLDPITDRRWSAFLSSHPEASVFHSKGWLEALQRTYGYRPVVFTTAAPGRDVQSGLVACEIESCFGTRLVSVPFADHCELLANPVESDEIVGFLARERADGRWRSIELRPRTGDPTSGSGRDTWGPARTYCLHRLELGADARTVFDRFHHSCIQRAIRRAGREGLDTELGRSDRLVGAFYQLLRRTRRRHGLPPQPYQWFRNLAACLGDALTVRVAFKEGQPIGAVLTLTFKDTVVYKYGGSDALHHRTGVMPYLFWQTILNSGGKRELDLGRTDWDQPGLLTFKDHLGARRSTLTYCRHPAPARHPRASWTIRAMRQVGTFMPDPAMSLVGRLVYKHLG